MPAHNKNVQMKLNKIYPFALIIYLLPPVFLALFIITGETTSKTYMTFWVLFLFSLLPCGLIGTALSTIGLVGAVKNKNQFNRDMGIIGVFVGLFIVIGGLLALGLVYVVTS